MTSPGNIASICILAGLFLISCTKPENEVTPALATSQVEKVILIVIDGPRYSETWGQSSVSYIPTMQGLRKEGLFFNNFYNDGITETLPGHSTITTGSRQSVINNGSEYPSNPSIFQRYLKSTSLPPEKAWIIASKAKLAVLENTKDPDWYMSYSPAMDIMERTDEETFSRSLEILNEYKPDLTLIHFGGPDKRGHAHDWAGYLENIRQADHFVGELWNFVRNDPEFKDRTAVLITADHGRHLDGISTGFGEHGDQCMGCKHIFLLALGPGIQKGEIIEATYNQTDIAPTIANLLNFSWEGTGNPIKELIPE